MNLMTKSPETVEEVASRYLRRAASGARRAKLLAGAMRFEAAGAALLAAKDNAKFAGELIAREDDLPRCWVSVKVEAVR